jgi:putative FmdB family regulatory protein
MPIYEFECPECRIIFERTFFGIAHGRSTRCPLCGGQSKKVMSASNFHLKGSGFYATDYKKPKGRAREDKDV